MHLALILTFFTTASALNCGQLLRNAQTSQLENNVIDDLQELCAYKSPESPLKKPTVYKNGVCYRCASFALPDTFEDRSFEEMPKVDVYFKELGLIPGEDSTYNPCDETPDIVDAECSISPQPKADGLKGKESCSFSVAFDDVSKMSLNSMYLSSKGKICNGVVWKIIAQRKMNDAMSEVYLALYLYADHAFTTDESYNVDYTFALINQQFNARANAEKSSENIFNGSTAWGWSMFLLFSDVVDPSEGWLINDQMIVKADFTVTKQ